MFQSAPRAITRGDHVTDQAQRNYTRVSIRAARTGAGRPSPSRHPTCSTLFQSASRATARGDTAADMHFPEIDMFQSAPRVIARSDQLRFEMYFGRLLFQSAPQRLHARATRSSWMTPINSPSRHSVSVLVGPKLVELVDLVSIRNPGIRAGRHVVGGFVHPDRVLSIRAPRMHSFRRCRLRW